MNTKHILALALFGFAANGIKIARHMDDEPANDDSLTQAEDPCPTENFTILSEWADCMLTACKVENT